MRLKLYIHRASQKISYLDKSRNFTVLTVSFKTKVHPITGNAGPDGEQMYSCTLSLTSALDGLGGQRHSPVILPPGKTRRLLYRRVGGTQGRSGPVRKISSPPAFEPRIVQPVASRYTDWAIPAHVFKTTQVKTRTMISPNFGVLVLQ